MSAGCRSSKKWRGFLSKRSSESFPSQDPVLAKAYLQKFRSRRMCGYVGLYKEYDAGELEEAILKQQSIDSVADLRR